MIKKRLLQLLQDSKKYLVLQVLCQWLILIDQIIFIFLLTSLIDSFANKTLTQKHLFIFIITSLFLLLLRYFLNSKQTQYSYLSCKEVKLTLREKIYTKLLALGSSYKEKIGSSSLMQLAIEGVEQLETYYGKYLPQLFYSLLAPLTLFIILSFINFKSALILLIFVPLIPISIVLVQKFAKKILAKYLGIYMSLGDHFLDDLQGLNTLKVYQADEYYGQKMDEEAEDFRKITMKVLLMQLNSTSVMDIMAYGGAAMGMFVALRQMSLGNVNLRECLIFIFLAAEFFLPMRILGSYFHIAMNGMSASDRIFEFLDIEEDDKQTNILDYDSINIEIKDLSFKYDQKETLNNISLNIKPKSFVALVGESGCGKSTLANILMAKHNNYEGSILFQNKELKTIKKESLYQRVCLLAHDSFIFKGSVEENLAVACNDTEKMKQALSLAQLDLDLNYQIEEGASNLSGGQRQRLALARALLHDSGVYIFDEASSNVDIESEALIMQVIKDLAKQGKTIILISHRLANVIDTDQIYFMQEGQIKEEGNHQELIKNKSYYYELYQTQAELESYGKQNEKA